MQKNETKILRLVIINIQWDSFIQFVCYTNITISLNYVFTKFFDKIVIFYPNVSPDTRYSNA